VRNFNFRCNLDEIDKIIEEDVPATTYNKSFKKPSVSPKKALRGVWKKQSGFNPRKSIGKRSKSRGLSKEAKPKTGLRINRGPINKLGGEDPILALLRQE
jgi:hypothetical protein